MLQSISWTQYITSLLFVLGFYYVYVGYKYFRWEILSLIGIKRIDEKPTAIPVAEIKKQFTASNHADFLPRESLDELHGAFQPYWDELNAYLSGIDPEASNSETLFGVKAIMRKYPGINNPGIKSEVEGTILGLLNQYFPEKFTVSDMPYLWG